MGATYPTPRAWEKGRGARTRGKSGWWWRPPRAQWAAARLGDGDGHRRRAGQALAAFDAALAAATAAVAAAERAATSAGNGVREEGLAEERRVFALRAAEALARREDAAGALGAAFGAVRDRLAVSRAAHGAAAASGAAAAALLATTEHELEDLRAEDLASRSRADEEGALSRDRHEALVGPAQARDDGRRARSDAETASVGSPELHEVSRTGDPNPRFEFRPIRNELWSKIVDL